MRASKILESFAAVCEAPNAVADLRSLVLNLAMRGQLVKQTSNDEPVDRLLDRLELKRKQTYAEHGVRDARSPAQISDVEQPWAIPAGWAWVRLDRLALPQAGFAFKSTHFNTVGIGTPLIRIRDIGAGATECFYDGEFRSEFLVESGDFLVGMDGNFNIRQWTGGTALLNQRVTRLLFFGDEMERTFVTWVLQNRINSLHGSRAYTTVQHLSTKQISSCSIPVPPLQEQRRIVTRVGELMKLCDALQGSRADRHQLAEYFEESAFRSLRQANTQFEISESCSRKSQIAC